jgi:hypothetical protein
VNIGSDTAFRDAFLEGAARTIFVCAYADYCEEHPTARLPMPGPGDAWEDFAPETPINAYALAGELWGALGHANGCNVYSLASMASAADGGEIDAAEFGSDLAMQWMGHGVSWLDDHRSFPLRVPHAEVSWLSFDESVYGEEEE